MRKWFIVAIEVETPHDLTVEDVANMVMGSDLAHPPARTESILTDCTVWKSVSDLEADGLEGKLEDWIPL